MKPPISTPTLPCDADAINATIERALAAAGLDTAAGPVRDVTDTIWRALALGRSAMPTAGAPGAAVIDITAGVLPANAQPDAAAPEPAPTGPAARAARPHRRGSFETGVFSNAACSRRYKVHVPAAAAAAPRPMIVLLHGCTQFADDFAAGTQMNRHADEQGFLVV